jgi:hypothetical protein
MDYICAEKGECCAHCDCADECEDACQWWDSGMDCDDECKEEDGYSEIIIVVDDPNVAESGICLRCGKPYSKTIGESNISMTGYCYRCGFNP